MVNEVFYTIKEATELYGIPNLTQLWVGGKFPNATLGDDKVVRLFKSDLDAMFPTCKPVEPPPDFTQLKLEAEGYALKIKGEADAYAVAIKQEADSQYTETIRRVDLELQGKRTELTLLVAKIDDLSRQALDLQEAKNTCLKKYNEIREVAKQNMSYHYNLAQRDRWGVFLDWVESQFRIK